MKKYVNLTSLVIFITVIVFFQCKREKKQDVSADIVIPIEIPDFNADSAFYFIEKQVSFGPRVPGTAGWAECSEYLSATLKRFGADVIIQETNARIWDGTIIPARNIIGSWQPENRNRILLCAHWDTRAYADWDLDPKNHDTPIDGANDGGSGVGVLLEIARHLSTSEPNIGIDIIFFDAEDYGEKEGTQSKLTEDNWALGSQYWAKNPHIKGYYARYGILLDMVGAKDAVFYMEGYSMHYAEHIVRKVWNTAHRIGYGKYFSYEQSNPVIDDHYYVNYYAGLPTINIIHQDKNSKTGFFKYWHTIEDTMDKIGKETLKAAGQTVMHVIYEEK